MRNIGFVMFGAIFCACPPEGEGVDDRPNPDPQNCDAACSRLQELGCPEGDPVCDPETSECVTCTQWCQETQDAGHALNAQCVAGMNSCDEWEDCE